MHNFSNNHFQNRLSPEHAALGAVVAASVATLATQQGRRMLFTAAATAAGVTFSPPVLAGIACGSAAYATVNLAPKAYTWWYAEYYRQLDQKKAQLCTILEKTESLSVQLNNLRTDVTARQQKIAEAKAFIAESTKTINEIRVQQKALLISCDELTNNIQELEAELQNNRNNQPNRPGGRI